MGTIRQEHREQIKSKLLHSAASLFLKRGYHASRITDITAAAGVDSNAVARVFGDKESLLAELVAYVLAGQFEAAEKLVKGMTDDKMLLYASETTLQLYMAESSEHIRELYSVAYSSPKSADVIFDAITRKLEEIFGEHLPQLTSKDFYELEIASGGIMRSYLTVPCDRYFTMERKVRRFLETTLRIYEVPTERINEAISFVSQFDYPVIAQEVIGNMLGYLQSKT